MAVEELVNHNHTPGRGHPNLGGHDAHVGKEVAVGMRGGRSFDKALAESQHYQLHRNEIATLPKRARRELHRHILGIANAHERAQGYPGHAFSVDVEEFYNKVHSKESGQFAPPNAAAVTAVKNAKAQGEKAKAKAKGAKATKKPDTSNWHRDRLIADALAQLKGGPKSSGGGGTSNGPVTGKLREQSKLKSNKPKNAAIKINKPKAVKASAAYAAVEEFYNHHHSPADGRFTGTTYSAGGTTKGGISKYRTNRVGLGNGLYPSKMRDQDAKSRKYHELQDLKVKRREKRHLGWFAVPEKSVAAAAKAVEEFVNHNHTPTSAHPNAGGGSWQKVTAGRYKFGSAEVEQIHSRAFGKSWRMRVDGKRISVIDAESSLKKAQAAVEGYLHGQAGTPDSTRMSPANAPLFAQTDYHRGFVKGSANVPVITAAEARGNSRPVSHEEFQRLATIGRAQLDAMQSGSSPTTGLDARWEAVKSETYAKAQESWGGATIDSHTGVEVPQGANVFALTVKGHGVDTVSVPEGASAAEFDAAMNKAKAEFGPILERAGHHLGVFHDDANHRIDIDPVIVTADHADVETIGAASHAIGGAYNFADGNGYFPPHVPDDASLAVNDFTEEFYNKAHRGSGPGGGQFAETDGGGGGIATKAPKKSAPAAKPKAAPKPKPAPKAKSAPKAATSKEHPARLAVLKKVHQMKSAAKAEAKPKVKAAPKAVETTKSTSSKPREFDPRKRAGKELKDWQIKAKGAHDAGEIILANKQHAAAAKEYLDRKIIEKGGYYNESAKNMTADLKFDFYNRPKAVVHLAEAETIGEAMLMHRLGEMTQARKNLPFDGKGGKEVTGKQIAEAIKEAKSVPEAVERVRAAFGDRYTPNATHELVSTLQSHWAEMADPSMIVITTLKNVVAKQRGIPPQQRDTYDNPKAVDRETAANEKMYGALAFGIHENSQRDFAARGLGPDDTVRLYRGMLDLTTPGLKVAGQVQTSITMHPVSSWSVDRVVAQSFGDTIFRSDIAVKDIFASSNTGFGSLEEAELVPYGKGKATYDATRRKLGDFKSPWIDFSVEQFTEEFRAGRSSPYTGPNSIGGRSPSLKWPHLYDILQAKGYDKESSAAISNSRVWMRKGGQLGGLPWAKADNKKALKGVLTKYKAKHGHEAAADAILEFVNHNHTAGKGHPNAGGTVAEAKARAAAVPAGKIVNPQVAENIAALKFHHGPGGRQDQLRGQHYSQFHDGRPVADCPNCKADKEHFDSLSPEAQIAWRRAN